MCRLHNLIDTNNDLPYKNNVDCCCYTTVIHDNPSTRIVKLLSKTISVDRYILRYFKDIDRITRYLRENVMTMRVRPSSGNNHCYCAAAATVVSLVYRLFFQYTYASYCTVIARKVFFFCIHSWSTRGNKRYPERCRRKHVCIRLHARQRSRYFTFYYEL